MWPNLCTVLPCAVICCFIFNVQVMLWLVSIMCSAIIDFSSWPRHRCLMVLACSFYGQDQMQGCTRHLMSWLVGQSAWMEYIMGHNMKLTEHTYQMKHWTVCIVFKYSLVESHCTKGCFHFTRGYGLYCARRHRNLVLLHLVEHGCLWAVQWESGPCAGVIRHHPVTSLGCVRIWALALCRHKLRTLVLESASQMLV